MTSLIDRNPPECRCTKSCGLPCWQRPGVVDGPCSACGCGIDLAAMPMRQGGALLALEEAIGEGR
jgi:hypothetical protein